VKLTVLGSNGTYPTRGRPASGYLVSAGGGHLLLDMGPGVFLAMLDRIARPDAVVLSHAHADHCADLLALLAAVRFGDPDGWGIPVYCPPELPERFAAFLGVDGDHAMHKVLAFDVVGSGELRSAGPFELAFGDANHSVPALITSVSEGGKRLVYSGDTGPGGDLERLATGCDLLLCEAVSQGEPAPDRYPYHLHAGEAGGVAARAAVGRLIVTHLAPTLDPRVSVREAAAEYDGPVDHAVPGMEVDV